MSRKVHVTGYTELDNLEVATKIVNSLGWNISLYQEKDGKWIVFGGDQRIFSSDHLGEIESFIVGMSLGLAVLPEKVIADIKKITGLDEI